MLIKYLILCTLIFVPIVSHAKALATCTLVLSTPAALSTPSKMITLKHVPIARTEAEMSMGLSKRKNVQHGMLFSWNTAAKRVFWMHDTWVDLSIGFFDEDHLLFDIQEMQANSIKYHYSGKKAKHALELSQGEFEKLGLVKGSRLIQKNCR